MPRLPRAAWGAIVGGFALQLLLFFALGPSPSIPSRYGIPEETPLRIRVPAAAPVRLDVKTSAE